MVIWFEWDPLKAEANLRKHQVTFERAREAFKDPHGLDEVDDKDDYEEERFNLTAMAPTACWWGRMSSGAMQARATTLFGSSRHA